MTLPGLFLCAALLYAAWLMLGWLQVPAERLPAERPDLLGGSLLTLILPLLSVVAVVPSGWVRVKVTGAAASWAGSRKVPAYSPGLPSVMGKGPRSPTRKLALPPAVPLKPTGTPRISRLTGCT